MKVKKTVGIIVCVLIIFLFMRLGAYMMSPGSDSRAEYYRVNIPTDQIIDKVAEFKERYPDYKVYQLDEKGDSVEYINKGTDLFHIYFADGDYTVVCVIKQINKEYLVGLTAVSRGSNFGRFKNINSSELPREENQKIKKKFEEEFLSRIGTWKRIDTGNSFFGLYF